MKLSFQRLKTNKGSKAESEYLGHEKSLKIWKTEAHCNLTFHTKPWMLTLWNLDPIVMTEIDDARYIKTKLSTNNKM